LDSARFFEFDCVHELLLSSINANGTPPASKWAMNTPMALGYGFLLFSTVPALTTVELQPHTVEAFDHYVREAEGRLDTQAHSQRFLWVDESRDRKTRVQRGEAIAEPSAGTGDAAIPDGSIHDWIGAVFVPGTTLAKTLALLQDYDSHKNIYKPEVQDSKLIKRSGNDFQVYLRLLKRQVITVVLNTNHDVRYFPLDAMRSYSQSRSTRIAEVDNPGDADEREMQPGQDHGFLWRLNSYWRFEQRDGGVYVECEAISLTRSVPAGLGWLVNPIVRTLPRESLEKSLRTLRSVLNAR
jgi:hypothetical protein